MQMGTTHSATFPDDRPLGWFAGNKVFVHAAAMVKVSAKR
jgi:hypothetical protein